jgi:hypothetical protein
MEKNKLNLFQRINLVMQAVSTVNKGSTVDMGNNRSYTAVSHDDVTALLHGPLTSAGIVALSTIEEATLDIYQTEKTYNNNVTKSTGYIVKVWASVTFINIDNPEERITTKCYAYALDSGDKATGKAYSMAVKYCYLKTFMLESLDEEESRDYEKDYQKNYSSKKEYQKTYSGSNGFKGGDLRPNGNLQGEIREANGSSAKTPGANSGANGIEASEAQKRALDKMGIKYAPGVTKSEASELIKKGNSK